VPTVSIWQVGQGEVKASGFALSQSVVFGF
jgi:hypothetical protein